MHSEFYRRHLSHWHPPGAAVFVTFRLDGALPQVVLNRLHDAARRIESMAWKSGQADSVAVRNAHKRLFAAYDKALGDTASNPDFPNILRRPECANCVTEAIRKGQSLRRFIVHRYCVMPNHVHLLVEPLPLLWDLDRPMEARWPPSSAPAVLGEGPDVERHSLGRSMKGLKGAASCAINAIEGRTGTLWQQESFDHWIRDETEYRRVIEYIDMNPVVAGLCNSPQQWRFSSAGEEVG